jgi:hypothetical protein
MAEATEYSLGIDLGRTPSPTATARGGEATLFAPCDDVSPRPLDAQLWTAHRIAATVARLVEREGVAPSVIVLAIPDDQRVAKSGLAGLVAHHLGLEPDGVRLIGAAEAAQLGLTHPRRADETSVAGDSAASAAALGAALSGAASLQRSASGAPLAAGAAGAVAGGIGGALLAGGAGAIPTAAGLGPTGVPLGPTASPGPAGVPLGPTAATGPVGTPLGSTPVAGPTGVPLGPTPLPGPTGTPLGQTAATGPVGTPLGPPPAPALQPDEKVQPAGVHRRSRVPLIAGAVAVVIVTVCTIAVAASGNDAPAVAPAVAETAADTVAPPASDAAVVVTEGPSSTDLPATTILDSTTSAGPVPATHFVAACVVGSWVADIGTISGAILANLPAAISSLIVVGPTTGTVRLEIGADGSMTNTYDNWAASLSVAGGGGTVASTASGVETGFATFADDGSYSGSTTQVDSHLQISLDGAVLFDGAPSVPLVEGSGTYTCTGDRLEFTASGNPNVSAYTRDG